MSREIRDHLAFLYGAEAAAALEPRLERLLRGRGTGKGSRRTPTQSDALLITYGDQVREEGRTPLASLGGFLQNRAEQVVSGVHILPFFPYSSDDGFSVVDYRQVDPELGGWEDVAALRERFQLMFDAVFNHCSAKSTWFQRFLEWDSEYRHWFITVEGDPDLSQVVRPRALPLLTTFSTADGYKRVWTTFSEDQVDLNAKDPEVLLELIDTLLFYVEQGAAFVRLDAIGFLWKEIGTSCIHLPQTHHVIQLMRSVLDLCAPETVLITETNVPHKDNISYFGNGHNEAQLVYNFALPPLVLHTLATGSAEALTRWASTLEPPTPDVTFFNFLASHDGIGLNPARGLLSDAEIGGLVAQVERHGGFVSYKTNPDGSESPYELNVNYFDALSDPAGDEPEEKQVSRFLLATAIQLAMAGMPGIYFHSLFGSRGDRQGAEKSGIKRRINRQKLEREPLETELADPASRRSQVFEGMRRLMEMRRSSAAFHPSGRQEVLSVDARVFAILRESPDGQESALCLHNVTDDEVEVELQVPDGSSPQQAVHFQLAPYESRWQLSRVAAALPT
ncbi:MAG TPA: sugar phosphorylase [Candidatus Dormibacteraeota bacterium]|nr:sugar phosphorylase [Candidatus Dormibacteraeota bacterium]